MKRATVLHRLAALALACISLVAHADYPSPQENYVNDYARRLDDATKQHLRNSLAALEADTGVEMSVAVIESVANYGTGYTGSEPFATGLFNNWGVGNRETNDGILLLVAISDRSVRIELGSGYGRAADAVVQDIIDRVILPHFRRENYDKGIQAGTDALIAKARSGALPLNSGHSAAQDNLEDSIRADALNAKTPEFSRPSNSDLPVMLSNAVSAAQKFDSWPVAGAGGGLLLLLYTAWRYFVRRRPRLCQKCRSPMQRLDESADDQHLNAGERLEENLESVDYDIWLCPSCNTTEKLKYRAWFSSFGTCPHCGMRTLEETTQVLQEATYSHEGSRRISGECRHCHHRTERTESIPQKQRSESRSSGSSSFGGGRSSGGGASGRW